MLKIFQLRAVDTCETSEQWHEHKGYVKAMRQYTKLLAIKENELETLLQQEELNTDEEEFENEFPYI